MKTGIIILIIASTMALSCSSAKTKMKSSNYMNCLPEVFENDLSLLNNSFNHFVNRNYEGQLETFLSSVVSRNLPNRTDFNESDFELADRLRTNNFRNFIYTEYEEILNDSDIKITPPRTANQTEDESRKMIKVDINKPYLNCMSTTQTKGKLIQEYVELQKNNPSISPLIIGELFLNRKSDVDYQTKLTNTIIAIELYYMILDSATKH